MSTELNARHGIAVAAREKLVTDIKGVVADADQLLRGIEDSTAEEFSMGCKKIEAKLSEAKSRLNDMSAAFTGTARDAFDATHDYVRNNPWKVFVGLAAGVIVGIFISRR